MVGCGTDVYTCIIALAWIASLHVRNSFPTDSFRFHLLQHLGLVCALFAPCVKGKSFS